MNIRWSNIIKVSEGEDKLGKKNTSLKLMAKIFSNLWKTFNKIQKSSLSLSLINMKNEWDSVATLLKIQYKSLNTAIQ